MIPCSSCNRHYTTTDASCPFCARPSSASRVLQSVGAALTTVVLAACYGGFDGGGKWDTADSGDSGTPPTTTDETTFDTGVTETGVSDTGTASDTSTNDTGNRTDTASDDSDTTGDTSTSTPTDTGYGTTTYSGRETSDTGL